jgi:hypothetical protein
LSVLQNLNEKQITLLKTAFAASKHPRFKREVASSRHDPYGKTADYIKYVQEADNLKLVKLIKILAMLSQTKIYLFWEEDGFKNNRPVLVRGSKLKGSYFVS